MNLYVNDVFKSYSWTNSSGIAYWYPWSEEEQGVYYYSARFVADNLYYQPSNEARLVVVAEVVPMCLVFDVQPHEFKPETPITLTAKVLNATSLLPLQGRSVVFYAVKADGSNFTIGPGPVGTNSSGVAVLPWRYPSGLGPLAFVAKVGAGQNVMSSPVMLTVAKETVLWLNVTKQSGFKHVISGRLLSYGEPVIGKTVKIYVNDTLEAELTTWEVYGNFSLTLDLPAVDNKPTTYNIQTVFEGDAPSNATAYAYTPNGTEYAVCTTIQYGFKPAVNSTMLTVTLQSTEVVTTTKTPEQIQAEAESNGWLKPPRPWFSWWYPWFRLYYTVVYNGNDILDAGLSPLGGDDIHPYSPFDNWLADAINEIIISPIAKALFIGWIGSEIAVYAGMYGGLPGFLGGLFFSLGIKELLFRTTSDSGLKGAFVGAVFSWAYGFITTLQKVVDIGITAISDFLKVSELNLWKLAFKFIYIPINMIYLIRIIFRLVAVGVW